ncbi:spinster family MFS transporter [Sphingosinicella terrae]|uniref:spinster family MFS transporter n=1 Tax=Sphingosinicella terrae TaxID=2172047 RepID=UPI000E0D759B|nr:MFS transporter [Sphingosinicella terrae]
MHGQAAATMPTGEGTTFSRGYRGWLLTVLLIVCLINYADRSVVGAVAEPLRRDLGLNDLQLGLLQGLSFALLYSVLGIPFARLAERRSRVNILAAATVVWSAATMVCGAAANFAQLLVMRIMVGVGEAGFMAPATSLLGDHFTRDRRAFATSIVMLGVPFGALVGAMAGGIIAQSIGWRWAFVIMGAPGLLIALLVRLTLREPPRGHAEAETADSVPPLRDVARQVFADPVFRHVLAGGTLAGFGLHGLGQFLGVYFARVHGLPLSLAGMIYGLVTFVSVGGGLLIGGALADRLGRRDLRWYARIPAIGLFLAAPLYVAAFTTTGLSLNIVLIVAAGVCLLLHYGPGLAIVQNLATARTRASTIAIYMLVVNAIALALAPTLIGWLSDIFAGIELQGRPGLVCAAGSAEAACIEVAGIGLRHAFIASTPLYLWAGIHYWLAVRASRPAAEPAAA